MERTIKTLRKIMQREEITTRQVDVYLHNKGYSLTKVLRYRLFYKIPTVRGKYLCVTFEYGEYDKPIVTKVDSIDWGLDSWIE